MSLNGGSLKSFDLTLKIMPKNGLLLRSILGKFGTVKQFATSHGLSYQCLISYINLRSVPPVSVAERLGIILDVSPEELFPGYLKFVNVRPLNITKKVTKEQVLSLSSLPPRALLPLQDPDRGMEVSRLKKFISKLSPSQQKLVTLYYGMDGQALNFAELARRYSVTGTCIKDRLSAVLRELRWMYFKASGYLEKDMKSKLDTNHPEGSLDDFIRRRT